MPGIGDVFHLLVELYDENVELATDGRELFVFLGLSDRKLPLRLRGRILSLKSTIIQYLQHISGDPSAWQLLK